MSHAVLPYGRQWVDEDDVREVVEALRGDYLTTGPFVERFEAALAAHTGAAHACAVNSGTAALHVAYFGAGVREGDEVLTSPLTFAATANAALYLGAHVRFVDVEPDTGLLDPTLLDEAVSDRTRFVVAVDYAGHPADYDAIDAVAQRHGLTVLADAAHSIGARYRGRPVGTLAHATAVSFHPVKPVTTGEGGAVLSDDRRLDLRSRRFRSHGITREPEEWQGDDGPWYYEMHDLGYNYRLTDLQCALGLSQLSKLTTFIDRRRAIARAYDDALADLPALELPARRPDVEPGWHLYPVRVKDPTRRRSFFLRLRELGLGVQVHYVPVHLHPYYEGLGHRRGSLPNAEEFYARTVSLPIFPRMDAADVAWSIDQVRRAATEVL